MRRTRTARPTEGMSSSARDRTSTCCPRLEVVHRRILLGGLYVLLDIAVVARLLRRLALHSVVARVASRDTLIDPPWRVPKPPAPGPISPPPASTCSTSSSSSVADCLASLRYAKIGVIGRVPYET